MEEQQGVEKETQTDLNTMLSEDTVLQSQFDRLVSKALTTARGHWEREQDVAAEQMAAQRMAEQEQKLNERERALRQRELQTSAAAMLGERGLPAELLDLVQLGDEAEMQQSVDKVGHVFYAGIEKAVERRLKGAPPRSGSDGVPAYDSQMRRAMGLK